jgi:4-hydroxybenzoyl-CoA thioesterase
MIFRTPIKVCFSDIDNAGIVYYPRFMHYFHLAVEEFFGNGLGIDFADVLHKRNLSLPTVHLEADFRHKLRYGDRINMEVRIIRIGRTSITWGYRGFRGDTSEEIVVEGQNTTVCVKTDTFEKIEVPDWLRKELQPYLAQPLAATKSEARNPKSKTNSNDQD